MIGPSSDALIYVGAKVACLIEPPYNQWWVRRTPVFCYSHPCYPIMAEVLTNINIYLHCGFIAVNAGGG